MSKCTKCTDFLQCKNCGSLPSFSTLSLYRTARELSHDKYILCTQAPKIVYCCFFLIDRRNLKYILYGEPCCLLGFFAAKISEIEPSTVAPQAIPLSHHIVIFCMDVFPSWISMGDVCASRVVSISENHCKPPVNICQNHR